LRDVVCRSSRVGVAHSLCLSECLSLLPLSALGSARSVSVKLDSDYSWAGRKFLEILLSFAEDSYCVFDLVGICFSRSYDGTNKVVEGS